MGQCFIICVFGICIVVAEAGLLGKIGPCSTGYKHAFHRYVDRILTSSLDGFTSSLTAGMKDVTTCEVICSDNPICASINYYAQGQHCYLNAAARRDENNVLFETREGWIYSEEICSNSTLRGKIGACLVGQQRRFERKIYQFLKPVSEGFASTSDDDSKDVGTCETNCHKTPFCTSVNFNMKGPQCYLNAATTLDKDNAQLEYKEAWIYSEELCSRVSTAFRRTPVLRYISFALVIAIIGLT